MGNKKNKGEREFDSLIYRFKSKSVTYLPINGSN